MAQNTSSKQRRYAITPKREEDFSEWYQQVIKASDLAEHSPVRGCMNIKPWGWAIWENIRDRLDARIKATGHQNAYFPLFVPMSFLAKEAKHIDGFAKECAVVTHHRLELNDDGELQPAGPLEEPLIIRPTSETVIGEAFSRWIGSWRDLPMKINQWANVVRWEMRTRLFLRTSEFLWQEGHTAHADEKEALEETYCMLQEYRALMEDWLALPVIVGEKSEGERFAGACNTYALEIMAQDRKAIQGGTSHYLGQNFSKAFNIRFNTKQEEVKNVYTTSWGVSTRLIGALIMTHADDDGLRLPPAIAPHQIVIVPIIADEAKTAEVQAYAKVLKEQLSQASFLGNSLRVHIDERDMRGGEKMWEWVKKGVPLFVEVGPRDIEKQEVVFRRRTDPDLKKEVLSFNSFVSQASALLGQVQKTLFDEAKAYATKHTYSGFSDFQELVKFFTPKNEEKPEIHGGFALVKWCQDPKTEEMLKEFKLSIRCIPLEQSGTEGRCILTGRPATCDVIIAKSY
jgi:prolyl-tRNA synthetase